jgi:curved DNA-binding protein CbpA
MVDYFSVLGVTAEASDREIKEAYRRLAKQYHPDQNPDAEAAQRMKLLNQAKLVLFDPVRREEHKVMLRMKDKLTAEQIRAFRSRPSSIPNYKPVPRRPHVAWTRDGRRQFMWLVSALSIFIAALVTFGLFRDGESSELSPIDQIIHRHGGTVAAVEPPEKPVKVPDDTLPVLRSKAQFLMQFGEYRTAAHYLLKCLEKDSANEEIIRDLSLTYFKQGKYAKSLQILSKQMHGDSNLVAAYYNIGELFMSEGKPFDARNSFQEVIRLGESMAHRDEQTVTYVRRAKEKLGRSTD